MRVRRYDRTTIPATKRTAEGFLRIDGSKIARVGIQIYRRADGTEVRELRQPQEVFSPESMASFKLVPLTNTHPGKLLDPNDATRHAVGAVGEAHKVDGGWLAADLSVWDREAIQAIENGRTQLSAGYTCELVEESGEWEGQRYDCKQVGIAANHLALVDVARAGPDARLRLDGADAEAVGDGFASAEARMIGSLSPAATQPLRESTMSVKINLDGYVIEVADANAQTAIERAIATARQAGEKVASEVQAKLDAAEKAHADTQKKLSETTAQLDAVQAKAKADAEGMVKCEECGGEGKVDGVKCDNCEGEGQLAVKSDSAERRSASIKRRIDRGVHARAKLLTEARQVLGVHEKLDGKTEIEIKRAVIQKLDKNAKLDGKDEAYVNVRYDIAIEGLPTPIMDARRAADPQPANAAPAAAARNDKTSDPEDARQRMIARAIGANVKASK